jgi:hypothetical protein
MEVNWDAVMLSMIDKAACVTKAGDIPRALSQDSYEECFFCGTMKPCFRGRNSSASATTYEWRIRYLRAREAARVCRGA